MAVALAAALLLTFRLVILLPGMAASEKALPTVHESLRLIWHQPLELPMTLSRLLVAALSPVTGIGFSRLPGVLLGFLLILIMYWLLRRWYNYRLALFGAILLMTAPWLLHVARLATNDIVYPFAMAVILALVAIWHQQERSKLLLYGSAVAVAILLYVPGIIWLLAWGAFLERRTITASLKAAKWHGVIAVLLGLALLVPLGHALYENWHLYRPLLGLPAVWPSVLHAVAQFFHTWQYIFIGGYVNPIYNLADLALMNLLMGLGFVVGLYLYSQHPKAVRTKQLAGLWLIGTVLVALGGPVAIGLILPIVVVLALGGIGYLLHLWLKVFPRNPLARGFGIGIVGLMIAFAVAYNVRNYYVAWPNNAETQAVFKQQL
ncbi:MAG: hypothetical protein JWN82_549 [Candidatus Saccharibacteria bacterium]|nr:hypothetical protein [Candidatus Saccharibacteria bacterium]